MKFGTQILPQGVRFRLWAPRCESVAIRIEEIALEAPMIRLPRGWFELVVPGVSAGMHYRFVLPDGRTISDPVSRFLPEDVDGASQIVDPLAFAWTDRGWRGHPWETTIVYEIHLGTFTAEGTFRSAIARLDHLVELGINTVEIMPVADFKGRWNWGYDGVSLFAPDASYGSPEDFKAFVDAAHCRNISVVLDVVYNHFGPKGNHLPTIAPLYDDAIETPWGPALNLDGDGSGPIRDLILANARYWLTEFHLDGLRFDALHEMYDAGPRHILLELTEQIRAGTDGRHIHLIAENSLNQAGWLKRRGDGAPWLFNAQWSDDIHHALHSVITEENCWYYADFDGRIDLVGRALAEGMAWQGEFLEHERRHKGEPSAFLPATAFVAYMQNHDQMGNRPHGERISSMIPRQALLMWSAINLLSPHIPLLFMGEEWAASSPFLFFSDVGEDLSEAIRESRRNELSRYPGVREDGLPDPMSDDTFARSKLDWNERHADAHAVILDHYRKLIALRKDAIIPRLAGMKGHSGTYRVLSAKAVEVGWTMGDGSQLTLMANLGPEPLGEVEIASSGKLWLEGQARDGTLGGWTALFCLTPGGGSDGARD